MSESYQKGRTGGVEGTYGTKRKGVAEKTAIEHPEGSGDLASVASSVYGKAVKNGGGSDTGGDPALRQR
ncbi:MAG: hypothetical protein ACRETD_10895 [Steroidobacteraceae bacterium]